MEMLSYSQMTINERINLKHNLDLGETQNVNKCRYRGAGAVLFMSRVNATHKVKNITIAVNSARFERLIIVRNKLTNKYA